MERNLFQLKKKRKKRKFPEHKVKEDDEAQ